MKKYATETSTKNITRTINYVDKTTDSPMPTNLVKTQTQTVTLTQVAVKNGAGKVIGYNTSGTWQDGKYTPSTETNGQIKVDTTDEAQSWMNQTNAKWEAVTNPTLTLEGYSGPFKKDGTTAYPTIAQVDVNGATEDSTLTVYYTENTVDVPPTDPKNPGDPITGTNKDYPNGVSEDDLNKTITRTINVIDASGQTVNQEVQTVKYTRTATVNVVTGDVKYSGWTTENSDWDAYAPTLQTGEGIQAILVANGQSYSNVTKDGDTLTGVGSYTVPNTDTKDNDETVNIYLNKVITLNGTRTVTYKTYDHNNQVTDTTVDDPQKVTLIGSQTFNPSTNKVVYSFDQTSATYPSIKVPVKTGYYASVSDIAAKTVSINNSDPIHSNLDDNITVNYHPMGEVIQVDQDGNQIEGTTSVIYPNNPDDATQAGVVTVPATPDGWVIVNPDDEKSFTPTDSGHDTKIYYEKLDKVSENEKQVTRTITYIDKDTGRAIPTSVVTPPVVQKATQYQFKVYDADGTTLLGYNTKGIWDENGNYIPSTQRNGQYQVDTTDPAESWIVKPNTNFAELTNPDLKQYGYSGPFEADGITPYPTINEVEVTGKTTNSEVKVYYTEDVVTVPPTEPHQPGEPITGTKKNYPDGVKDSNLNKTITRTIKIVDADGNLVGDLIVQKVAYSRTAKVNVVTGHVDYENWTSDKKNWDSYAPTLQTGEGIQTVTDGNGQPYSNLTRNGNLITGVGSQNITYNATDKDDQTVIIYLNKAVSFTGTRAITYSFYNKDGQKTSSENGESQTVTVSGSQTFDPAPNKVVYTFENPSATYPSVPAPVKTGYYASTSAISDDTVSINQTNPQNSDLNAQANVDYYPMGEVIQVDGDGNQIPGTTPATYPNNSTDPTKAGEVTVPKAPEGWVIVTPSDDNPFTPTDPGEDKKIVYEKLDQVTENSREVTRTINYVDKDAKAPMPTNLAPTVTQTVTLTQYIVKDASGKVLGYNTSGTWTDGKYAPSTEDNGQIKVDTTDEAKSWMNGFDKNFESVTNPNLTVDGYSDPFEENGSEYPTVAEMTVNGETPDKTSITVYYTENTVTVPPDKPIVPDDGKIPNIPGTNIPYPNGVSDSDLNKTITRTINVYDVNGELVGKPVLQTVKYSRTAIVNVVTGKVIYTDWAADKDSKGNWNSYAPTLQTGEGIQSILENGQAYDYVTKDGDKLTGVDRFNVPAPAANTGDTSKNEIVNIYLNKKVTFTGTRTITYITHEKTSQTISIETKQNVRVSGLQSYDPTNGKVVYSFDNPSATYSKVDTPVKDGYYASASQVREETKTISKTNPQDSDLDAQANVDYYPMGEVIQVDVDGNQIPGTTPVTYPNDPSDPTKAGEVTVPKTPEGWVIVDPSQDKSFTPTDPGTDTKVVYEKLDQVTENTKDVIRTINYVDKTTGATIPTDLVKPVTQTVTLTQSIVKNSTGKILGYNTTGTWADGKYTPSTEVDGQIKVDTTDETQSWMNASNAVWAEVTNPDLKVDGYSGPYKEDGTTVYPTVAEEVVTGTTADSNLTVYYTENTIEVPPTAPKTPDDPITGTNKKYPNGVNESDLNKTITRTINTYGVDGKLVGTSEVQTVKYTRIATVNVVTGKVTYTDWTSDNNSWKSYIPLLQDGEGIESVTDDNGQTYGNVTKDGNKIIGVDSEQVSENDKDEIINIYLNKVVTFKGTRTITYTTHEADGKPSSTETKQNVTVSGLQSYDPTNGKVIYRFDDPSATYDVVKVPVKNGYYASVSQVPTKTVSIDQVNPQDRDLNAKAKVDYYPMGEVIQVDRDGKQIPGTTPVTYPNEPSDPTKAGEVTVPKTPEGWVIVNSEDGEPFIPDKPGVNTLVIYKQIIDSSTESKVVNRKIIVTTPDGKQQTIIQTITVARTVTTNKATGKTEYGEWSRRDFPSYVPDKIEGYITLIDSKEGDSVNATPVTFKDNMPEDGKTVYVTYQKHATPPTNNTISNRPIVPDIPTFPSKSKNPNKPVNNKTLSKIDYSDLIQNNHVTASKPNKKVDYKLFNTHNKNMNYKRSAKRTIATNKSKSFTTPKLPQTGSKNNIVLSEIAGLGSMLGSLIVSSWTLRRKRRKRKH